MNLKVKNILLLISLCASFFGFSQNAANSKGKQGPWKTYHEDGKTVRYVGQFKDDKPIGKFVYYYRSGEPSMVVEHGVNGTSECKSYHLNGSLMSSGSYVNQLKEGTWWYFNNEKKVMSKEVYANGVLNGMCYEYFPTAADEKLKVLKEINYVNGLAQGAWKLYYKDGKLQSKGTYKDGLPSGERIWYSASGKEEMIGYYKDGKKHGRWRSFDKDGETTYIVYRKDVELHGKTAEIFLESLQKK
jgi:antitoxin component YwqK of YwqJK toxin-antitoxin module